MHSFGCAEWHGQNGTWNSIGYHNFSPSIKYFIKVVTSCRLGRVLHIAANGISSFTGFSILSNWSATYKILFNKKNAVASQPVSLQNFVSNENIYQNLWIFRPEWKTVNEVRENMRLNCNEFNVIGWMGTEYKHFISSDVNDVFVNDLSAFH